MGHSHVLDQSAVRLIETPSGHWIVEHAASKKGGCFVDRRAALVFIRRELGITTDPIVVAAARDTGKAA